VGTGVGAPPFLPPAPLASANESHEPAQDSGSCAFTGGTGGDAGSGDASGGLAASGLNFGGTGGSNVLNIADCSSFLNGNGNGNHFGSDNVFG
jgi:hypothetical protein